MNKLLSLSLGVLLLLTGCAGNPGPAPVVDLPNGGTTVTKSKNLIRSDVYKVKKGETLYSIAWRADMDVSVLAQINKIKPPYRIFPGQPIYLNEKVANLELAKATKKNIQNTKKNTGQTTTDVAQKSIAPSKKQEYGEVQGKEKTAINKPKPTQSFSTKVKRWVWPAKGKVIRGFSSKPDGSKGIDIAGKRGDSVRAAADGKVVYAGNALSGYGNLVIVKHNEDYLSAYAHNDKILVKEQQRIKSGQLIAKMGDSDSERVNLHFEIRFRGKSVNPLKYLPRK